MSKTDDKIKDKLVEYKNELEKVRVLYYKLLGAIESTETLLSLEEEEKKK